MKNEKSHHPSDEHCKCWGFHFKPAKSSQRALLHQWFKQKHIKEWMHGWGRQNTLNGLVSKQPFKKPLWKLRIDS